jgi:hypothetical protein
MCVNKITIYTLKKFQFFLWRFDNLNNSPQVYFHLEEPPGVLAAPPIPFGYK